MIFLQALIRTVAVMIALAPLAAMAEQTICTPTTYLNWSRDPAILITIDAERAGGSTITSIDIETGLGEDLLMQGKAGRKARTYRIVDRGSLKENQDFIAVDDQGALLHIDLRADPMTFTRTDAQGTVAAGTCIYEWNLPKP